MTSGRLKQPEGAVHYLRVRLDKDSKEVCERLAAFEGLSLTAWARKQLLRAAIDGVAEIQELKNENDSAGQ